MTILYAALCRGSSVLAHHQVCSGKFEELTVGLLKTVNTERDTKTTFTSDNYLFHVLIENGIVYLCCTQVSFGRERPHSFLLQTKQRLVEKRLLERAYHVREHQLDADFSRELSTLMQKFSVMPNEARMELVKKQVDEVKGIMSTNIAKVLQRGDKLDDLMTKTDDLESHAVSFKNTSRQAHYKMRCKNHKMTAVLVTILALVLTIFILYLSGVLS